MKRQRKNEHSWEGFREWLASQIIQDVPEEIALCEYDCAQPRCPQERWSACQRRILAAQGELMPNPTTFFLAK